MPCPVARAESLLNLVSCITCSVAYVSLAYAFANAIGYAHTYAYAFAYAVCLCSCICSLFMQLFRLFLYCCFCLSRTRVLLFSVLFLTTFADYKQKENSDRIKKVDATKKDWQ